MALQLNYLMDQNFQIAKYIDFKESDNVYAIELPPGKYTIGRLAYFKEGIIHESKPLLDTFSNATISVEAGKAYYIGDFVGWAKKSPPVEWQVLYSWKFHSLSDEFMDTTELLIAQNSNFGPIAKLNIFKSITTPSFSGIHEELLAADAFLKEKMFDKAVGIFRHYAYEGVPYAQFKYGMMHANGWGVKTSIAASQKWYQKSADLGNTHAMLFLGRTLIEHSRKAESTQQAQDHHRGRRLIEAAANNGNLEAMMESCRQSAVDKLEGDPLAKTYAWCQIALKKIKDTPKELRKQFLYKSQFAENKMDALTKRKARNFVVIFQNRMHQAN
ncbi:MAG: sel1 repeat family protein [Gammaproteobacteria bacterium]|nr:sel1 repeat family protein [Gammaproteobacteria bacterium]